MRSLFLVN